MSIKLSHELLKQILQDIQVGRTFLKVEDGTTYLYADELTITAQVDRGQTTLKLMGYNKGILAFEMPFEIALHDGDTATLVGLKMFMEVRLEP